MCRFYRDVYNPWIFCFWDPNWLAADQTLDVMLDKGEIDVYTALHPGPATTGEP